MNRVSRRDSTVVAVMPLFELFTIRVIPNPIP